MFNMIDGTTKPDANEIFNDGILYIISEDKKAYRDDDGFHPSEHSIAVLYMSAEYDPSLSLSDIKEDYPNVKKVIFDDAMHGYVYNYDNHKSDDPEMKWELVGTTIGWA